MKISLCMIVKDEESNLKNCLSSVYDLMDEIVIVDTGSSDCTIDIAMQYTDKIYYFDWIDDFAAARNFSFSKGSMEYLMWLDADDIMTEENRDTFRKMKSFAGNKYDVIYLPYLIYDHGALSRRFFRERIVKRDLGFTWQNAIHEVLSSPLADNCKIYYEQNAAITHTGAAEESTRNLNILKSMIAKGNSTLRTLYHYATALNDLGFHDESIAQFEAFFERGGHETSHCLFSILQLSKLYIEKQEWNKVTNLFSEAMPYCQDRSEFCCQVGDFYREHSNDAEEAIFWYNAATRCPYDTDRFNGVLERYYYYVPYYWLWQLYASQNKEQDASTCLQKALYYMQQLEDSGKEVKDLFSSET